MLAGYLAGLLMGEVLGRRESGARRRPRGARHGGRSPGNRPGAGPRPSGPSGVARQRTAEREGLPSRPLRHRRGCGCRAGACRDAAGQRRRSNLGLSPAELLRRRHVPDRGGDLRRTQRGGQSGAHGAGLGLHAAVASAGQLIAALAAGHRSRSAARSRSGGGVRSQLWVWLSFLRAARRVSGVSPDGSRPRPQAVVGDGRPLARPIPVASSSLSGSARHPVVLQSEDLRHNRDEEGGRSAQEDDSVHTFDGAEDAPGARRIRSPNSIVA